MEQGEEWNGLGGQRKAIRPGQLQQILSARLHTPEAGMKLLEVPGIVFDHRILGIVVW